MRCIDADALVNQIVFRTDLPYEVKETVEDIINDAPTIEPERKTGKWIWQTSSRYMCSECGQITTVDECMEEPMYIYCPYCGARMTKGSKQE